jgi:hypothetical protein
MDSSFSYLLAHQMSTQNTLTTPIKATVCILSIFIIIKCFILKGTLPKPKVGVAMVKTTSKRIFEVLPGDLLPPVPSRFVRLKNTTVEVPPDFNLFIVTSSPSPIIPAKAFIQYAIVDFSATGDVLAELYLSKLSNFGDTHTEKEFEFLLIFLNIFF